MLPTLNPGALVLICPWRAAHEAPRRGEIVAARPSRLKGRAVIKRVAGMPGETIRLGARMQTLRAGEYFLLGESLDESTDSRSFGPVTRQELIGSIRRALWPWRRLILAAPSE